MKQYSIFPLTLILKIKLLHHNNVETNHISEFLNVVYGKIIQLILGKRTTCNGKQK